MELEVFWTQFAQSKLKNIFKYYKKTANLQIARNLVTGIVDKTILIPQTPGIGQEEELFQDRNENFRYLVFKDYKIIYWVNEKNHRIEIVHVFDCRQNPQKMIEETK